MKVKIRAEGRHLFGSELEEDLGTHYFLVKAEIQMQYSWYQGAKNSRGDCWALLGLMCLGTSKSCIPGGCKR